MTDSASYRQAQVFSKLEPDEMLVRWRDYEPGETPPASYAPDLRHHFRPVRFTMFELQAVLDWANERYGTPGKWIGGPRRTPDNKWR